MFQFIQFSSVFLFKFLVFTITFLTIISINFSSLPTFAQSENNKITNLISTSVPQDQKPFIYYFPYQTDGQNTKINVSLVSKKGDSFSFIPSESVDIFDSTFQKKPQFSCNTFVAKRNLINPNVSTVFDTTNLANYTSPAGNFDSKMQNIGCIGMKIKVTENAQIGDETQIVFENILNPKIDNNLKKLTQTGTLKIVGKKSENSNNYSTNSKSETNEIKPPPSCFELPDGSLSSNVPCMPSIPGTTTKTRYSGQSFEFKYNENSQKYETILKNNVDYKDSVEQVGCYNLKNLNLDTFGCGKFLEDEIELYTVNYSFLFPISQRTEFQNFYQKQGFTMNPQSLGVQWQVEYYRFKDSRGNFGKWQSYAADIYHKKTSDYTKFVDPKSAEWIRYEINSISPLSKAIEN